MDCSLNQGDCIACGLCQVYAPTIFDYDDEGIVIFLSNKDVVHQKISGEDLLNCEKAASICPVHAIKID